MSIFAVNELSLLLRKLQFTKSEFGMPARSRSEESGTRERYSGKRNQSECFFIACPMLVPRAARAQELQSFPEGIAVSCRLRGEEVEVCSLLRLFSGSINSPKFHFSFVLARVPVAPTPETKLS